MRDIEVVAHFRDLVSQFKEKERSLLKAINSRDFENPVYDAIDELVRRIKEELGEHTVLKVDDLLLRNDLCAIRENRDFIYFKLLRLAQEADGAGNSRDIRFVANLSEERWWQILSDELLPHLSPSDIITRKTEIGALLVGRVLPEHLKNHLIHIKECYTWGFDSAAAVYCRTILEEGFREALKSKQEFRSPQQRKELEGWSLDWLLKHSKGKKYFYVEVLDNAYRVKENVNHIVHPTSARKPDVQMTGIEVIRNTFYILEMLFR